jgi:hypothetical protein
VTLEGRVKQLVTPAFKKSTSVSSLVSTPEKLQAGLGVLDGVLPKAMAAIIIPTMTLIHNVAPRAKPRTNGEIISQMPSRTLIALQPR